MFRLFFILIILSNTAFAQRFEWAFNDVSVLFPLPHSLEANNLLGPRDGLLPHRIYKRLPKLADFEDQERLFKNLFVVALRIDPLQDEIRMVYQPIEESFFPFEEGIMAKDMAIHVFHKLDSKDFKRFLKEYRNLKLRSGIVSSKVPGVNESMAGSFGKAFKALVLKFTSEKNISKVTFMRLESIGGIWAFGGFDVQNGMMKRINIPRINKDLQMFTNVGMGSFLSARIEPAPRGPDTFNKIIEGKVKDVSDSVNLVKEVKAAVRVEDPRLHSIETMDCVSCHTAMLVRHWSFKNFPEILNQEAWPRTQSTEGLTLNNVRAFGYHEKTPTINQRTVNETLEIVSLLNAGEAMQVSQGPN